MATDRNERSAPDSDGIGGAAGDDALEDLAKQFPMWRR
jgi:hypothetical protein